ncbi:voltage-dependent calcium channel subunit alpha-2/delta-3-like isoform X1 [Schistocerca gregaria]|uniref:voltage-dependent calcium channel subunit alpha-2/delta-3-like isoform X1 n=1 Tax=Schistocerca gregaria TaxID=7010 RepID=UPI00211E084E|nr:voltage-dependent calcium channel subunit alpha-2/delta-3-like isoform X1 [Schistocerca gregaria]
MASPLPLRLLLAAALLASCAAQLDYAEPPKKHLVLKWADQLGDELWRLTTSVTRAHDVRARYKYLNASVKERSGAELLKAMIENVERMLKSKIVSVKCIMQKAEQLAESFDPLEYVNFTYHSAKCSPVNDEPSDSESCDDEYPYAPMYLEPDRQFSSIPVNRSHSSVHVPTNVFDLGGDVYDGIKWSEGLDEVFIQNLKSDPTISWQLFGGATGFMRMFPAMKWAQPIDLFDCRTRSWYIEASTCSKDVVVLMDTTGSMKGLRHTISKHTVRTILDTLSNNDFVNVFNFSERAQETVPCFKNMLVQATLENVNTLKDSLEIIDPEGVANFSQAFIQAFKLLEKSRNERDCGGNGTRLTCNQAVMLITDSVTGNITEVFEIYNRLNNGSTIPVRVFTFLVGREVTKVMEIKWMACLNRGVFKHIQSLNEVRETVFQYIPIIAQPLVLQGEIHPVVWTHADADVEDPKLAKWLFDVMENLEQKEKLDKHFRNKELYFSQREEDNVYKQTVVKKVWEPDEIKFQEYHLVTSVSVPAFERRMEYTTDNKTEAPSLLGIAGIDVPIPEIEKLTMPYKIGVNGYAFIVTNNGYVLLHPDLRPVSYGYLKDNYNSVDLTEVELLDSMSPAAPPRELPEKILELRERMVNHEDGEILNISMKYHYDDMRRVMSEERNYYFSGLEGTPFSLGISLPEGYGKFYLRVNDIIKDHARKGKPVTNYFQGNNWKVHPNWLYCRYFHGSLHNFTSPEREVYHFLESMSSTNFQWKEMFAGDPIGQEEDYSTRSTTPVNCDRPEITEDEYYCEKELMQMLVFDGRLTHEFFGDSWSFENTEEYLIKLYNTSLKFMATQSGLTRWQYIMDTEEGKDEISEFGDLFPHSVEEAWYKAAVIEHKHDPESVVISAPFDAGRKDDVPITLSHAIFPRDAGKEAPASVVGLQIQHRALYDRFMSITEEGTHHYNETCAHEGLDCYLLDSNGYIVISETLEHTGQFFGEVEGAVMKEMVELGIFREIPIYDYQSLCFTMVPDSSAAGGLWTPIAYVQWLISELLLALLRINVQQLWSLNWATATPLEYYDDDYLEEEVTEQPEQTTFGPTTEAPKKKMKMKRVAKPCDQKYNLYVFHPENLECEDFQFIPSHCSRPFIPCRVPHTSLLLVVVDSMRPTCFSHLSAKSELVDYNDTEHPCHKLPLNKLPRSRFSACFTEDPREELDKYCGAAAEAKVSQFALSLCGVMLYVTSKIL